MSTQKSTQADNKQLKAENKAALKVKFPKAKLLKQFAAMAEATGSEQEAAVAKRQTAYVVCQAAETYRKDAYGTDSGQTNDVMTILNAWRAHWKGLIAELHTAQSPFVELGEADKKGNQKPVMTGYGRNVAGTARGIIEFDIATTDDNGTAVAYTEMNNSIVKERRDSLPADKRSINVAKDELAEALIGIRKSLGTNAEAIVLFSGIVGVCAEAVQEHGADGLAGLSLLIEDNDLDAYLTVTLADEETEEQEADAGAVSDAENEGLAEEVILQTG